MGKGYIVQKNDFDRSNPWMVIADFRSWNKVIARYPEKTQADRRARALNERRAIEFSHINQK